MFTDVTHPKFTRKELDLKRTQLHPSIFDARISTLSFTRNIKHHFSTLDSKIQLRTRFYTLLVQDLK